MELTGACKEEFEKWYLEMILNERLDYNKFTDNTILNKFYREINEMKFGVLQKYFDSVGLYIETEFYHGGDFFNFRIYDLKSKGNTEELHFEDGFDSRGESLNESVKMSCGLRNQQLKND